MFAIPFAVALGLLAADDPLPAKFTDVQLVPPYDQCFRANPVLLEMPGARILELYNGHTILMAVVSVALEGTTPKELLDGEKVCRLKALREIVSSTKGVRLGSVQRNEDRMTVILDPAGEQVQTVSKYYEVTEARLQTVVQDLPVIGRWRSADSTQLYVAIGAVLDKQGRVVPLRVPPPRGP